MKAKRKVAKAGTVKVWSDDGRGKIDYEAPDATFIDKHDKIRPEWGLWWKDDLGIMMMPKMERIFSGPLYFMEYAKFIPPAKLDAFAKCILAGVQRNTQKKRTT